MGNHIEVSKQYMTEALGRARQRRTLPHLRTETRRLTSGPDVVTLTPQAPVDPKIIKEPQNPRMADISKLPVSHRGNHIAALSFLAEGLDLPEEFGNILKQARLEQKLLEGAA